MGIPDLAEVSKKRWEMEHWDVLVTYSTGTAIKPLPLHNVLTCLVGKISLFPWTPMTCWYLHLHIIVCLCFPYPVWKSGGLAVTYTYRESIQKVFAGWTLLWT